jgi:prophage antirepressor-like protein
VHLPTIFRAIREIFPDTLLRTGFSTEHQAAFIVAADLRKGVGYKANAEAFVRTLVKDQGAGNSRTLYVGDEIVQTAGGPQSMKVVYKRGVFHLLMRSDLPKAAEYRDQIFDLVEQVEREGFAVNASAPVEQLRTMRPRIEQTIDELLEARLQERKDYRTIVRAVRDAGGYDRDFADVQNLMYFGLFGMSADTIKERQPQVSGERYKRDYRGNKAGDLRPSKVAKDFLTREQLKTLDNGVLFISSKLALRHPDGAMSLDDIKDAAHEVGAEMRGRRTNRGDRGVAA